MMEACMLYVPLFTDATFPHVPKGLRDWFVLSEGGSWSGLCQTSAIQMNASWFRGQGGRVRQRGDPCAPRVPETGRGPSQSSPRAAPHDDAEQ